VQCDPEAEDDCIACSDGLVLAGARKCSSKGLSTGAIAGIVIAVVVVVVVVVLLTVFLVKRKRAAGTTVF